MTDFLGSGSLDHESTSHHLLFHLIISLEFKPRSVTPESVLRLLPKSPSIEPAYVTALHFGNKIELLFTSLSFLSSHFEIESSSLRDSMGVYGL